METKKYWKPYEFGELGDKFQEFFGVKFKDFWDKSCLLLFKRMMIDIFAFDDYLHELYGDYESEGKSMSDVIVEHYGEDANGLIKELM